MSSKVFSALFIIVTTIVFYTALILNVEYFRTLAQLGIRLSQQSPAYEASFADILNLIR
ncbi:hypothetical protein KW791_00990 [Candidatus Parcubacteria bacterium]|nr:hypothetical protein [Candidatus Parcubacteria bacterium]